MDPVNETFFGCLPRSVADLRTEAYLPVIIPWFMKSLEIPGDVCEFGCFRGTMSIKFAYALKAFAKQDKTVYAFDTFEGFQMDDPSGGALTIGSYSDNNDAFGELTKWGKAISVRPMKGDAREVCKQLSKPLSYVWLDLDFAVLMEPVLDVIWPLITKDTIIGIDDVGRPETPSVLPWVEKIKAEGKLIELAHYDGHFISYFRANKA
jgi:hypothetical protein